MNNNELYHYGVPGMRWGQRKSVSKVDKVSARAKKRGWSDDATEVAKIQTKKVNQMSNKELQTVNNRKSLEQNYSRLNPGVVAKGLAIAGATVAALGTIRALTRYGKSIGKTGKSIVEKFKDVRVNAASKAFWKGMQNATKMGSDFSDLLK